MWYLQKTKIPARGLKLSLLRAVEHQAAYALQKTKIPARGLKPKLGAELASGLGVPSKNQNPREGIETGIANGALVQMGILASKNQNPREGIETWLFSVLW